MVSLAALNSSCGRDPVWSSDGAFGDDECACVAPTLASGAALSHGAGDRLLVGCLRRRLRRVILSEYAFRVWTWSAASTCSFSKFTIFTRRPYLFKRRL